MNFCQNCKSSRKILIINIINSSDIVRWQPWNNYDGSGTKNLSDLNDSFKIFSL